MNKKMKYEEFDKRKIIIKPARNGIILEYIDLLEDGYALQRKVYLIDKNNLQEFFFDILSYLELNDFSISVRKINN